MKITIKSQWSQKNNTMELPVTEAELRHWRTEGLLVQEAFPDLTSEQREFLISGMTPEEWHEMEHFFTEEEHDQ